MGLVRFQGESRRPMYIPGIQIQGLQERVVLHAHGAYLRLRDLVQNSRSDLG